MNNIIATDNQAGLFGGRHGPFSRVRTAEVKTWSIKKLEPPVSAQHSAALRIHRSGTKLTGVDHETASGRIRRSRQVDPRPRLTLHMEPKVVRYLRREDQRCPLDWKDEGRTLQAKHFIWIYWPKGGQRCPLNSWQTDNQYRLRLVKGRRVVKL